MEGGNPNAELVLAFKALGEDMRAAGEGIKASAFFKIANVRVVAWMGCHRQGLVGDVGLRGSAHQGVMQLH